MGTRSQSLLCTGLRSLPLSTWETRAESPARPEVALKMVAAGFLWESCDRQNKGPSRCHVLIPDTSEPVTVDGKRYFTDSIKALEMGRLSWFIQVAQCRSQIPKEIGRCCLCCRF